MEQNKVQKMTYRAHIPGREMHRSLLGSTNADRWYKEMRGFYVCKNSRNHVHPVWENWEQCHKRAVELGLDI